ncbi:MAG: hypothetical protein R3B84_18655 [Zavarzinella sp.]
MTDPMTNKTKFSLDDDNAPNQVIHCECATNSVHIRADDYRCGNDLVRLENRGDRLVLLIWADVNDEQPTHEIDLESARQRHRNKVIAESKRRLRNETLTTWEEGKLFRQVFHCINWRTGKQYTMREAAKELGIDYARFRNHLVLTMTFDGSTITDQQREQLLRAPIRPSKGLISLLRTRPTEADDR